MLAHGAGILLAAEIALVYGFVGLDFIRVLNSLGVDTLELFGVSWHPEIDSLVLVLGKLVFPTFLAIVLWVAFNQRFLERDPFCSSGNSSSGTDIVHR